MKASQNLSVQPGKNGITVLVHPGITTPLPYERYEAVLLMYGDDPALGMRVTSGRLGATDEEIGLGHLSPGKYKLVNIVGYDTAGIAVTDPHDNMDFEVPAPSRKVAILMMIFAALLLIALGALAAHLWCSSKTSKGASEQVDQPIVFGRSGVTPPAVVLHTDEPEAPSVPEVATPAKKPARQKYTPPLLRMGGENGDLEYTVPENDGMVFPIIREGYSIEIPSGHPIPPGRFMRVYFSKTIDTSIVIPWKWVPFSKIITNTGAVRSFDKNKAAEEDEVVEFMDIVNDSNSPLYPMLVLSRGPVRVGPTRPQ